mgnify:CR=1 FL=1
MNYLVNNRTKSFIWRTGMMVLAFACVAIVENLGILELDPTVTTVIGLILGEVSKYLNTTAK